MIDARLLLPLTALPDFEPQGLWAYVAGVPVGITAYDEGDFAPGDHGQVSVFDLATYRATWHRRDLVSVSLGDADTRDRAARWLAARLAIGGSDMKLCTAPIWTRSSHGSFELSHPHLTYVRPIEPHSPAYGPIVPALADLSTEDNGSLPDGSLLIEALALAIVCCHAGGTP